MCCRNTFLSYLHDVIDMHPSRNYIKCTFSCCSLERKPSKWANTNIVLRLQNLSFALASCSWRCLWRQMCRMFPCFHVSMLLYSKSHFLCCWKYIVDYSGNTGHPQHYNYWQVEQIATIILLQCNSLLGNFGTSILVGVTLTCTTHLNIIADQVCPLEGTRQRDFTSLVPWIIWISEPRGVWVNFFHFSLSFSPDSTHLRYIFQLLVSCLFLNMIKCMSPSLQSPQIPIQFSIQAKAWTTTKNPSRPEGSIQCPVEDALWGPLSKFWQISTVIL